jgi:hypothetical protein
MLDRYEHAPSEEFAKTTMVPISDGVVIFYEQHDPKPEPGKAPLDETLRLKLIPFFLLLMPPHPLSGVAPERRAAERP